MPQPDQPVRVTVEYGDCPCCDFTGTILATLADPEMAALIAFGRAADAWFESTGAIGIDWLAAPFQRVLAAHQDLRAVRTPTPEAPDA